MFFYGRTSQTNNNNNNNNNILLSSLEYMEWMSKVKLCSGTLLLSLVSSKGGEKAAHVWETLISRLLLTEDIIWELKALPKATHNF